jgi:type I restriction enzyme M protein
LAQLEHIEAIEKRLWGAADTLRANSNYASNEYFMPVMGLVFLRHAYSRYLAVKDAVEADLPSRGGVSRTPTKEDFSRRSAILLREKAQFDYLVALPDKEDRAKAIIEAMESIEADYENLRGVLPKGEYQELDNSVLGQLLRTLNPDELKQVSGDVFGRIYEYFLTQFADQKAHDGGEFFTPVSLVSLIAHVLDPQRGTVLDPACGSGGMFVQSARTVEEHGDSPTERLTFRGLEKNATTIRLAKMNLAVHGLEGDIQQAITYYEDPHEFMGKADYVMANPPFNVDEIDADKVRRDPRLPFGLPGVNKKGKVSNGNYMWISYFYSYLNEAGRAGFVMSSQASSAGGGEATVRQKLVETGDVEAMIAIRSNFFYTRTVPCELWFLNRNKPYAPKNKVLMIDARGIYRKVTRRIYDFSPEQKQNILAMVWLYRGQKDRYLSLVRNYCQQLLEEAVACLDGKESAPELGEPISDFRSSLGAMLHALGGFLRGIPQDAAPVAVAGELADAIQAFDDDTETFRRSIEEQRSLWAEQRATNGELKMAVARLAPLAEASRDLVKQTDRLNRLTLQLVEASEDESDTLGSGGWSSRELAGARKGANEARRRAADQLKQVRYPWKQAHWLTARFPEARIENIEGLVKVVDCAELEVNDWSLTPGRYVGVAPEEEDEDFDFEEALKDIHVELEGLNEEAVKLGATIGKNFRELGQ